jgi:hypothetical protein
MSENKKETIPRENVPKIAEHASIIPDNMLMC